MIVIDQKKHHIQQVNLHNVFYSYVENHIMLDQVQDPLLRKNFETKKYQNVRHTVHWDIVLSVKILRWIRSNLFQAMSNLNSVVRCFPLLCINFAARREAIGIIE